jgi:hypothetical protein
LVTMPRSDIQFTLPKHRSFIPTVLEDLMEAMRPGGSRTSAAIVASLGPSGPRMASSRRR